MSFGLGHVDHSGPRDARLAIIGEAPGPTERERGFPMAGWTGSFVNAAIGGQIGRDQTFVVNASRCAPPSYESEGRFYERLAHYSPALSEDFKSLTEARTLLLVGAEAFEAVLGPREIMQYHGSVFTRKEAEALRDASTEEARRRWMVDALPAKVHSVVTSLHPAFTTRGLQRFQPMVKTAIVRANNWSMAEEGPKRPTILSIHLWPTRAEWVDFLDRPGPFTVDVETGMDASHITMASVTRFGLTLVARLEPEYRAALRRAMESKGVKVGHNIGYDASAFALNGFEVEGPLWDTIDMSALLWPPPRRKEDETSRRKQVGAKWLSLAMCALRVIDGITYWKQPTDTFVRAIYRASYPWVDDNDLEGWYCGLDGRHTEQLSDACEELLHRAGMWGLFKHVVVPAKIVLHRMEMRGLPLDVEKRDEFRREAKKTLRVASDELEKTTAEFHEARVAKLAGSIEEWKKERDEVRSPERCRSHPSYTGITNRSKSKCVGCRSTYEAGTEEREWWKELGRIISRGKQRLASIGPKFKVGSDKHWIQLLFNKEIGCGLKPLGRTKKTRQPKMRADDIERLATKYPDNKFLRLRLAVQSVTTRLDTRLAVEPGADGCVHFAFSGHRSNMGRIVSGKDDEEIGKLRASAGNQQNILPIDREIYRAPEGMRFVDADSSQIEARIIANLAGETAMLEAWKRGIDVHSLNGAALARALGIPITPDESKVRRFFFAGAQRTFRYAAKRLTHGWNYGMKARHTAEVFGLTESVAQRMIDSYFEQWPKIAAFQRACVSAGTRDGFVVNCWGRRYPFFQFTKDADGTWVIADPNVAIAQPGQSNASEICKTLLPQVEATAMAGGGELVGTSHDSYASLIPLEYIPSYVSQARALLEQEWLQIPVPTGYATFQCPADFSVGVNWGPHHEHTSACPSPCDERENPDGMKPYVENVALPSA